MLVFGNQGALWGNAMTWWDHDTGTIWSQPLGEAIVGPREGARLELMSSQLTEWETWLSEHPESLALDAPARSAGFDLASMSIVIDLSDEVGVYPVAKLVEHGPANDLVAGVPVSVLLDPTDEKRWRVFHRLVGDQTLTLHRAGDQIVDIETGTVWDPVSGRAIDGELEGSTLDPLPGFTAFEDDARTFWPDADYWDP